MKFTDEMIAEDEKRWHARDVVMELDYCSNNMRDRRNITNLDIRYYAYIMRRAHEMLKAQEPTSTPEAEWLLYKGRHGATCSFCKHTYHDVYDVENYDYYCRHCGAKMVRIRTVKWK